jgi:leucine-rich repeat-containing protein 49
MSANIGRDCTERRDLTKDRDREKRRESLQESHPSSAANVVQVAGEKPPSDGVFFAQYKGHPETLVVYRSPEERAANPERLNLDRRHLTVCPILKSEERVRLLNYQNNYIEEIRHLSHLPNLIFLDLYNNCIESLSRDLECVPTLRVLMLGKNRIKAISHLEKLGKLDVLDLHSNAIARVEQLGALSELRVLNLAGNRLTELDELGSLQSLTELNVRRNQIVKANSLQQLQSLQRVFLSNNRVQSFDAVACLFDVRFLMELSMDGNPIALQDPHAYRRFAVERVKTLRHLDLKRVTDAERRAVALESQKEDERRRAAEKHEMLELERRKLQAERHEAIRAAERQWIDRTGSKDVSLVSNCKTKSGAPPHRTYAEIAASDLPCDHEEKRPCSSGSMSNSCSAATGRPVGSSNDGCTIDTNDARRNDDLNKRPFEDGNYLPRGDRLSSRRPSLACSNTQSSAAPTPSISSTLTTNDVQRARSDGEKGHFTRRPSNSNRLSPAAGYYEVEIGGLHREERILQLYGEAWECFESQKIIASSTALVCRFVSVERIIEKLRPHARNFTRLKKATFGDNAIHTLRHVLQLANVLHGVPCLLELKIESNPVCSLQLLRPLICTSLPSIERFNGITVSAIDRVLHCAQIGPFRDHAEAADKHVKSFLNIHDNEDHNSTKRVITTATTNALHAEEFRRILDK